MHNSRLATIVIDCKEDIEKAVEFWSQALGIEPDPNDKPGQRYYHFKNKISGSHLIVQDMNQEEDSAFHIDIETDDVEAEVKRLESLGAIRKNTIHGWWIMTAPSGHTFCIIPNQFKDFPEGATTWKDG